jgi:hypothetical protein
MQPFWPHTASDWAPLVGLVFVVLAAIYGFVQLRQATQARHAALFADLSRRWSEPAMEECRHLADTHKDDIRAFVEELFSRNDKDYYRILRSMDFFEDLAVMVKVKEISFEVVKESLGGSVVVEWSFWKPVVEYLRAYEKDDPLVYANFEALAKRTEKALTHR